MKANYENRVYTCLGFLQRMAEVLQGFEVDIDDIAA